MSNDAMNADPPELSAAAEAEWRRNIESVLRGVAHALNNRAASIAAVIELSKDEDGPEATQSILAAELQRMKDLSTVVRSLGTPRAGSEAFSPRDAASEALAVLVMHADQRERVVLIEASSSTAVRVPRWMFVRALIALATSVPVSGAATHSLRVTVSEDGEWVTAVAEGARGSVSDASPYATELARAMGGEPLETAYGFRLPSLATLRKREGR